MFFKKKICFIFSFLYCIIILFACRTATVISDNGTTTTELRNELSELGEQQAESRIIEQQITGTGKDIAEQSKRITELAGETRQYLAEQAECYSKFKSICEQVRKQLIATDTEIRRDSEPEYSVEN